MIRPSRQYTAFAACLAGLLSFLLPRPGFGYDVITIGDSWAGFIANGAPGSEADTGTGNALQTILDRNTSGKTVYNGSFYGGTTVDHLDQFGSIISRINYSGATIVYLSTGGNDLLAGKFGDGMYLGHPDQEGLFDEVMGRIGQIVNRILDIRPDIQVVIGGYDYVNMWDTDLTDGGLGRLLRQNYGLGLDGTGYLGVNDLEYAARLEDVYRPQQQQFGELLRDVEQLRGELGADSRRVHFVKNLGVNNEAYGYDGIFGTVPAGLPRSDYDDYPVTLARMGSGGEDPIHLDTTGYELVSQNCYDEFFETAFEDGVLALGKTSLEYGAVLVGREATESVAASNAGANFTKIGVQFAAASAPFEHEEDRHILFQDPTLGSDTMSVAVTFAPMARGEFSETLAVEVEYGDDGTLSLEGKGVAPVNQVTVDGPVYVRVGTTGEVALRVTNTGDGNLSGLGEESNLRGSITVAGGSGFSETELPEISLADGGSLDVSIPFAPLERGAVTTFGECDFANGHRDGTNEVDFYAIAVGASGIGPVFSAGTKVDLGPIEIAAAGYESFQVANITEDLDGGDGDLTVLTLLSASITGADADAFELVGFAPGVVVEKGGLTSGLALKALNDGSNLGAKSATLTFLTDVGAAAGQPGASYQIALSAVFVPEPSATTMLMMFGIALAGLRRRRE